MRVASIDIGGGRDSAALVVEDRVVDLGVPMEALLAIPRADWVVPSGNAPSVRYGEVRLMAPVPRPAKVIAIGMNYRDHCLEQGIQPPVEPLVFAKFPSSIVGPDTPVSWPTGVTNVDWEVELAVVVGARDRAGRPTVAGYTIANDVSARDLQARDVQFVRAKSIDTFCPMGPWLVTPEGLPDPVHLALSMHVNGVVMQRSNTDQLLFDVPSLMTFCAHHFTLEPGDVILTGTPPGVGVFRKPPVFLAAGDTMVAAIDGIGALRSPVTGERPA
ncbi:MAG TPA: fumarylacetoacetate hydrolase family protein [Candidatus Limnocylindria bacterium]|nr:fumarylacetoacetate hydrolase family protein [Candidatus Limnocylindria bacterium]